MSDNEKNQESNVVSLGAYKRAKKEEEQRKNNVIKFYPRNVNKQNQNDVSVSLDERIKSIRGSLDRINQLMAELRNMSEPPKE
jgi:hypothetical protein